MSTLVNTTFQHFKQVEVWTLGLTAKGNTLILFFLVIL